LNKETKKMKKLLLLTCAAAAMVASATDLPWTGSETSLGGGKVTLTYDGYLAPFGMMVKIR
jgi:hypothetical protein